MQVQTIVFSIQNIENYEAKKEEEVFGRIFFFFLIKGPFELQFSI